MRCDLSLVGRIMHPSALAATHLFGLALIDDVVTWFAQKLSLLSVTMWGIQILSTMTERALLLVLCSVFMAITIFVTRRVRSDRLRPLVPLAGALVLFRGL